MKRYFKTQEGISVDIVQPEKKEPLKEELTDFIRCVQKRTRPKVSAEEGRDALKVVLEINKMIRNSGSG
jgi:predicted dehydrogenase